VRQTGQHLLEVIGARPDLPKALNSERLKALFDPTPAVQAASMIVPAALDQAAQVTAALSRKG
jgi:hypothetical protein